MANKTRRKETRTYKDRSHYLVLAVSKRRRKLKSMAIELKGGVCQVCGYGKCVGALSFHHLDKKSKSFDMSTRGLTRSWKRVKEEANKCILVCENCHREIHAGLVKLPVKPRI
jgi:predicted HNH restriction endonuclease